MQIYGNFVGFPKFPLYISALFGLVAYNDPPAFCCKKINM